MTIKRTIFLYFFSILLLSFFIPPVYANVSTEVAKLMASDGNSSDWFGQSVAINGDTAVAGAPMDDENGINTGAAFVYVRNGTDWVQQAKLIPPSPLNQGAQFGRSVAIDNDTIIIGAPYQDHGRQASGGVYVFKRNQSTWSLQTTLLPDALSSASNLFGFSVAIDDGTIIVGALGYNYNFLQQGSAFVYTQSDLNSPWQLQQQLVASDGSQSDAFGVSLDINGNTAVIGAYTDENGSNSGSAYVFQRTGTTWAQHSKLLPFDGGVYGHVGPKFGHSVAIDENTIVIGSPTSAEYGLSSGSVYVYTRTNDIWSHQAKLLRTDGLATDEFGYTVDIENNTIIVGSLHFNRHLVFQFTRTEMDWIQQTQFKPSYPVSNYFGNSVGISGNTVISGAYQDSENGGGAGAAYLFN